MLGLKIANSITQLGKTGFNIFSLLFVGTDESVTPASGLRSDISTSTGTISFWTRVNTMSSGGTFFKIITATSDNSINLYYHAGNNEVTVSYKGGGSSTAVSIPTNIENDGKWHNITVTWDTDEEVNAIKIYLDGTLKETGTELGTFAGAITGTSIGNNAAGGSYVKAYMSNFAIFDSVTTVSDIFVDSASPLDLTGMSGLIAYYKFDEGVGTTALDSSGKGYDATLINTPAWSTVVPYKAN